MWATTFLVGFWLTITPPTNLITPTTDVMLVEFSRVMNTQGLFVTSNYTITDEFNNVIPIQDIEVVNVLDGDQVLYTTVVALIVPKIQYRTRYSITVRNLRAIDNQPLLVSANTGTYWNNGYAPNLEQSPKLIIK